jgi:hypothetical protein
MNLARQQVKRFESLISAFILVVLVLIAVIVFIRQSNYDMSRFGITGSDTQSGQTYQLINLAALAPAGFGPVTKTETYNADNLYEKIDGKAPLYTESGFEKLSTRRFVGTKDEGLVMELYIYDMGTARNAFSVYSVQKRPEVKNLPNFTFAYTTSNALYLAHGRYYVEVVGFSGSARLLEAIVEVGQKIQKNLAVDDTRIPEIELFPAEDLVAGSIKLDLKGAFGFEELTDTFTCRYKLGSEIITAFLSRRADPQNAQKVAESYYNFLINNGGSAKHALDKTPEYKVVDFSGATEIIFTTGSFVGGVHEAEKQPSAENLAAKLANKLKQAKVTNN